MSEPVQVYTACQFVSLNNISNIFIESCPKSAIAIVIIVERKTRGRYQCSMNRI